MFSSPPSMSKRSSKILALSLFALSLLDCSRMFVDPRSYEETRWTIERAKSFIDSRPLHVKAEAYEDLLDARHFAGGWFTPNIRLLANNDPYGYNVPFQRGSVSDSAAYGGGLLSFRVFKWAVERRDGVPTDRTEKRLDDAFRFIDTICRISGRPGLVVRGYIPPRAKFNVSAEDIREDKWFRAAGEFQGYWFRSGASPGQFTGVAQGLLNLYWFGPERYKEPSAKLLEQIALYLIETGYRIVDVDGELTEVPYFNYRSQAPLLWLGTPRGGSVGIYFDPKSARFSSASKNDRILMLMTIMRAAALAGDHEEIRRAYLALCAKGYARKSASAGFNFFGVMDGGRELARFEAYFALLGPEAAAFDADASFVKYYRTSMERVWKWVGDYRDPAATAIWVHLTGRDRGRIAAAIDQLDSYPHPKRRRTVVNSNRPDIDLTLLARGNVPPEPLAAPRAILPVYLGRQTSFNPYRDPRRLDSAGDGTTEYSYVDFLYAYWLMRWLKLMPSGE